MATSARQVTATDIVTVTSGAALTIGQNFGPRYHIIRLLGIGGMGAVYQAWDQVLEVAVAVKVIRLEATPNAAAAENLERRFKRELLLARQVTHKNVVRIHDLGEIDGIKYITMPYVQGSNLATILKRDGRFPIDRALALAAEIAGGLAAAHAAGVVHRDLKPANIMVDAEGNAQIMDFGIARSASGELGVTAAGVVVGTIEYMAPEQARGETADARADIYSFGLILNDVLLGRRQGTMGGVAELMARMRQAPASLRSIDPTIPAAVDAIVSKCLQPDAAARYGSVSEVLADLERLDKTGNGAGQASSPTRRFVRRWRWGLAACVVLAVAGIGWGERARFLNSSARVQGETGPLISLAILPFRNASGDVTLDSLGSSVSEVLRTELGQSSRVRTVASDRLLQVLQDLRIAPNATLAPAELARVADLTSARSVLWGQFTRFGDAVRIDATLRDLDSGRTIPLNAMAPNEGALLTAIGQLAEATRQDLARGSADILNELKQTAWKPSTSSFEAVRLYNEGVQLTQRGNYQEAQKRFDGATKQDGNFALAFSALARSYATLGYDTEAAQFSRRAMSLANLLPAQERYLISANHYQILNDTQKAIESYENLAKASPTDSTVHFDLGGLYEQSSDLDRARQHFAKVVELDPKFVEGLLALGRVEIRRGHSQESLDHLNAALTLAIQLDIDEARANILQAIGVAYKRLNRLDEALRRFKESLDIKTRLGNKRGMAASFSEIAQVQTGLAQMREAEQSYNDALKLRRDIGDRSGISLNLINLASLLNDDLGRPDEALRLLKEAQLLAEESSNSNQQALALNNIGSVYFLKGQYADARTYFERALQLREKANVPRELADTQHNLADTLSKLGRYDQSLTQYLLALDLRRSYGDRRAAAIESYSIGALYDYQGHFGRALKSKEEALRAFRELKQRDTWFGEILGGYGHSVSSAGRMDDAAKTLDEALAVAHDLKNQTLIAQALRFQSERLSDAGDLKGANRLAEQAAEAASHASDSSLTLLTQADVAMTAAALQPTKLLASKLAGIGQQADAHGLKFLSVGCSIRRAETLLKLGDRADRAIALQELERTLAKAETLGARVLLAKTYYLRAEALRLAGDGEARRNYESALRLLDEIKGEDGNQNILKRDDLGKMRAESLRLSKGT